MSCSEGEGEGSGGPRRAGRAVAASEPLRPRHPHSFKLRFAAVREQGRSYVSAVRPQALPAVVTDKFYARAAAAAADEAEARAERYVRDAFARGPRERLAEPLLSSHEYGWLSAVQGPRSPRAVAGAVERYHLRDSPWLRGRLRLLAER